VAPYLDDQAILVAHIDLSRIDTDATFDLLARHFKDTAHPADKPPAEDADEVQAGLNQGRAMVKTWLTQVQSFGAHDVYVVVTLTNVFQKDILFAVLPLDEKANPQQLMGALGLLMGGDSGDPEGPRIEQFGQALVIGTKATHERLKKLKPTERPELVKAFTAALSGGGGDTAAQIAYIPSADTRRALEELLPTLPAELGGGSSTAITRGALWAAVGISLPPKASVSIMAQAESEPAAKALLATLNATVKFIATSPETADEHFTPLFQPFAKAFNPVQAGDRVTLTWDQTQIETIIFHTVAPMLGAARNEARGVAALANLHSLGVGIVGYAMEHDSQLPPDLGATMPYCTPNDNPRPYLSPQANVAVPDDYNKWDHDKKAAWVNANSSFIYLGQGKKLGDLATPGTFIVVYEDPRLADHGRIAVGYADGHAQTMPVREVLAQIAKQQGSPATATQSK
jgi:hypothetical protein